MSAPDFCQAVTLALKPRNRRDQECCREIADHLLEHYEESLRTGVSPEAAEQRALSALQAPSQLRRRIRRAQGGNMRRFFSTVLLPGIVMTAVVVPCGFIFEHFLAFRPHAYFLRPHAVFVYYWYMMPAFLAGGAVATWYSRHRGGTLSEKLMAGSFLALAGLAAIVLPMPLALAIDPHVSWATLLETLAGYLLSQVIVPAIPMLLGALPFLFSREKPVDEDEQGTMARA